MTIQEVRSDHYRIPLPLTLSDSTHGEITHFELVTVRIRDAQGAEGMGYTVTVGAGGGALHALIRDDLAPLLLGEEADRIEHLWKHAFLSVTSPLVAAGVNMETVGVVGNAVGAMKVGIVGHRESVEKIPLVKFLTALLK